MRHLKPLLSLALCAVGLSAGCSGQTDSPTGTSESAGELSSRSSLATLTGTVYRQTYPVFVGPTNPERWPDQDTDRAPMPNTRVSFIGNSSDGARVVLGSGNTDANGRYEIILFCVGNISINVQPNGGPAIPGVSFTGLPLPTLTKQVNCGIAPLGDIDLFVAPNDRGDDRVLPASW